MTALFRRLQFQLGHGLIRARPADGEYRLRRDDGVVHVAEPGDWAHGAGIDHAVLDEPIVDVDAHDLPEHHPIAWLAAGMERGQLHRLPMFALEGCRALLDARRLDEAA